MFSRECCIKYSAGHRATKTTVSGKERIPFDRPALAVLTKHNAGLQNREAEDSHYERFPPGQGWRMHWKLNTTHPSRIPSASILSGISNGPEKRPGKAFVPHFFLLSRSEKG